MVDAREIPQSAAPPRPITVPDWIPDSWTLLLPGSALWALALYIPLSVPLARLEEALSTAGLSEESQQVVLITECSMAANVAGDVPGVQFIGPCNLCPHMQRITLLNIRDCLLNMQFEVTVPEDIAERARLAVQRMVDLPPPTVPARYDMVKARHHVAVELI